jgi:hypothetical protein
MRLIVEDFDPEEYYASSIIERLVSDGFSFKVVSDTDIDEVLHTQDDFEGSDWSTSDC